MNHFEKEQTTLMRYRLVVVWLTGAFLLGIGLRELWPLNPETTLVPAVTASIGLVMLMFGYSSVHALRDEAIHRRDRSQEVLDSHESLNTSLFGHGHVRLVTPDDTA